MNNISFVTYTHTNCKDIWPIYLNLLEKHCPNFKNYMLTNQESFFLNALNIVYDDTKNYSEEMSRMLEKIEEEYIIYMQEDFLLYDNVDLKKILNYINILENSNFSFIRLIKCGDVSEQKFVEDLYYIKNKNQIFNSINSFSLQPTIWKKKDLLNIYKNTNFEKFGEGWSFTQTMNKLKINGLYAYNNEKKRGMSHYDSSVFPYIATAIVKSKWNTLEYKEELKKIFEKYNIEPKRRGTNG